jgi:LmbE family N-acetylglucosaminyl deacetylase
MFCATRGEVGSVPEGMLKGYASVADLREAELRCASLHLGLAGLHFLGYRDSGMSGSPDNHHPQALVRAPLDKVASDVTLWIRRLRPQVVITFDVGSRHLITSPSSRHRAPCHAAIQMYRRKSCHPARPALFTLAPYSGLCYLSVGRGTRFGRTATSIWPRSPGKTSPSTPNQHHAVLPQTPGAGLSPQQCRSVATGLGVDERGARPSARLPAGARPAQRDLFDGVAGSVS